MQDVANILMNAKSESILRRLGENFASEDRYPNFSLVDLAEAGCRERKLPTPGNAQGIANTALTSGDLGGSMANVGQVQAVKTFNQVSTTADILGSTASLQDFRATTVARLKAALLLEETAPGAESPYSGGLEEGFESVALKTWSRIFGLDRQIVVNDDIMRLLDLGSTIGLSGKMTLLREFMRVMMANGTMGDGYAQFSTDHGNLLTSSELNSANTGVARKTLRAIGLQPKYLLVPPSLEEAAAAIVTDTALAGPQSKLELLVEPLLEDTSLTGYSATSWYMFPDTALCPNIRIFGFERQGTAPTIDTKVSASSDNLEFKVRQDFAIKAINYRCIKCTA